MIYKTLHRKLKLSNTSLINNQTVRGDFGRFLRRIHLPVQKSLSYKTPAITPLLPVLSYKAMLFISEVMVM